MDIEFDEKGKFFTNVVTKISVPSTIQTTSQLIRGEVHVRKGERLKDELDRDEPFLAITNASVLGVDGQVQFNIPFLAVQRSQIIWVFPHQEESQE